MLLHPTLDQLQQLGLQGMAKAFAELDANPNTAGLSLILHRRSGHLC